MSLQEGNSEEASGFEVNAYEVTIRYACSYLNNLDNDSKHSKSLSHFQAKAGPHWKPLGWVGFLDDDYNDDDSFPLIYFLLFLGMLIVFVLILSMPATLTMQTKLRKRDATTNIGKLQNLFFITTLKKSILAYSCCKWPKRSSIIASKEISGIRKNILNNQRDTTFKKSKQTDKHVNTQNT